MRKIIRIIPLFCCVIVFFLSEIAFAQGANQTDKLIKDIVNKITP